jgi:Fe(3+) dicitrate transport protein
MKHYFYLVFTVLATTLSAQTEQDSLKNIDLKQAVVTGYKHDQTLKKLPDVHQTFIIGGRKSEVINVQDLPANIAEKTGRQIFAKIPGAFIYDMDGSGNQVNIATRGLDPHRSWELNVRQNGVVINSDMYGYPASHYSPPMEAIKSVEMVRGTAALQYGAEFGGMINYITKTADTTRAFSFETMNSVGSFGLLGSYNAVGGRKGKWTYYGYIQRRSSEGYRENARSRSEAQFAHLKYQINRRMSLALELGRNSYVFQSPGPLTDSMFRADPRQSTRSRNFYQPDIYVPSVHFNWQISDRTQLNWIVSGLYGSRNSVEFEGFADRADAVDPTTGQLRGRVVNIDQFDSKTSELRLLHHYHLGRFKSIVAAGVRYFNNDMNRRQQGKGSNGTDFDLSITGDWGRNLWYRSESIAFSVENLIYLTDRFSVAPGFRYEYGKTDMTGYISYLDPQDIPNRIDHNIPAFGVNTQYLFSENTRFYAGISQAHRPVLFKDIIPTSTLERANKDLKNAFGYNLEAGINGRIRGVFKYDVTLFRVQYNNRLGNIVVAENGTNYILKTNIGNSYTNGVELFAEATAFRSPTALVSMFSSTSLMEAKYQNAQLAVGSDNRDISGNAVESVPRWISRNGINAGYKKLNGVLQYSYVAESFSDPVNTVAPTPNGARGIVPAYGVWDLNLSYRVFPNLVLRAGINNLLDQQYFTKRPLFYPGPGVWSSDGRGWTLSMNLIL